MRRAISTPSALSARTRSSSESGFCGGSAAISARIRALTACAECVASPSPPPTAVVKKNFISSRPRGVAMNLFAVTRLTVDSCTPTASATAFSVIGLSPATPCAKNRACARTISAATVTMVRAR